MPSFCQHCGRPLQDGEVCNCTTAAQGASPQPAAAPPAYDPAAPAPATAPPASDPAAPAAPAYEPAAAAPPVQEPAAAPVQAPVYDPAAAAPPVYDPAAAQQAPYPPQPGAQQAYPPQPGQPPYPPQAGQPGQPYPPQPGQPYPPQQPAQSGQQMQQVQQSLGEFTSALGGFAKDPVGAAAKVHSPAVAGIFLGVQAICFLIFAGVFLSNIIYDILAMMGYGMFWYADESFFTFGSYLKMFLFGVIAIALMYGCLFCMTKITKITIEPMKLLSAMANASTPWSAAYLVMMLVTLIFGALTGAGLFLNMVVGCFAIAASICLLEIGIRAQMPQGEGNVARLITIACAFAAQAGLSVVVLRLMSGGLLD